MVVEWGAHEGYSFPSHFSNREEHCLWTAGDCLDMARYLKSLISELRAEAMDSEMVKTAKVEEPACGD